MSSTETMPPMRPDKMRFSFSFSDLRWVVIVIAAGAVAWGITTRNVAENTKRIDSVEAEARKRFDSLESEARNTREVLIRIDERTGEIKRRLENNR